MSQQNPVLSQREFVGFNRTTHQSAPIPSRYDLDLQHRVSVFLANQHRGALRNLSVEARDGIVTLHGRAPSFYEREISVRLARRVAGVLQIVDKIVIGCLHTEPRHSPRPGSAA